MLPLNRLGFFQSLRNHLTPVGKIDITINWTVGEPLVMKDGVKDGLARLIVSDVELRVPRIEFQPSSLKAILADFNKPKSWTYLSETTVRSPLLNDRSGVYKIVNQLMRPKYLFVWFVSNATQEGDDVGKTDKYLPETIKLGVVSAQVEVDNGYYIPSTPTNPKNKTIIEYHTPLEYTGLSLGSGEGSFFDHTNGPYLTLQKYAKCYPYLFYDIDAGKKGFTETPSSISFHYSLDTPGTGYYIHALVLSERTIEMGTQGGVVRMIEGSRVG